MGALKVSRNLVGRVVFQSPVTMTCARRQSSVDSDSRVEPQGGPSLEPDPKVARTSGSDSEDRGAALMLRWRDASDESAFEELVELYSGEAYALVTRFLGRGWPGREDLVQEAFVRIVRARDRYEPTARFSTWLYSIVYRLCVNESQRSRHRGQVELDASEAGSSPIPDGAVRPPDVELERQDAVKAVRNAIASLPENQRIAVVLARYHDLPYAEIAKTVGSTEKAIKSLIHRARETLREQLRPFLESSGQAWAEEATP